MIVAVTKIPVKSGSMDRAQGLLKELAAGVLENVEGIQRVYYTTQGDSIHAFGVWDSAAHYTAFADGGAMAKALEPFREMLAGPPSKTIHDCFHTVVK